MPVHQPVLHRTIRQESGEYRENHRIRGVEEAPESMV